LCVDVGGTAIKAAVLDAHAACVSDRVRRPTPYPLVPDRLTTLVCSIATELGGHDRASVGFPGLVRDGRVLTAPLFVRTAGPGSPVSPSLAHKWEGRDLRGALQHALDRPVRVGNDADVHGAAVVTGDGLELVVTLGTGVGTGLFLAGRACPHLELAHHPLRDGETYNERLGDAARRTVGDRAWSVQVLDALGVLDRLVRPDHVWIGGGNARHLDGPLPANATVVDDDAGVTGGVHLWRSTPSPAALESA
jgi:polyphosphate glucokinase